MTEESPEAMPDDEDIEQIEVGSMDEDTREYAVEQLSALWDEIVDERDTHPIDFSNLLISFGRENITEFKLVHREMEIAQDLYEETGEDYSDLIISDRQEDS